MGPVVITVCCCLWNEFPAPGSGLAEVYVNNLRNAVRRNLSRPHRFVCFCDRPYALNDIEIRPLAPPSWVGHLPKLFVYSPAANLSGRVILFDLDNVVVGSLEDMASYDGPLCVRGRLNAAQLPDGDMISFDADRAASLWDKALAPDLLRRSMNGREREFILWAAPHADTWQKVCPGQVVSYRHHCRNGLPAGARVVSMHGNPQPHQVTDSFITDNWQ